MQFFCIQVSFNMAVVEYTVTASWKELFLENDFARDSIT